MRILFLCVANSARSQMAEGLAKDYFRKKGKTDVEIWSAGSEPSGKVHPQAISALRELDIDISANTSKAISDLPEEFIGELDFAVTLCAEEVCPVLHSGAQKLHWGFPDPAGAADEAAAFRTVRDGIIKHLESFSN